MLIPSLVLYNLSWDLIILMLALSHIWPSGALQDGSCVFVTCLHCFPYVLLYFQPQAF